MICAKRCLVLFCLMSGLAGAGDVASLSTQNLAGIFDRAIFATAANDGTGRLFVIEQNGRIMIHTGMQKLPEPFLDYRTVVEFGGERGLLGLAFDPGYVTNGWFYISYTGKTPAGAGNAGTSHLVAMKVDPNNSNKADTGTAVLLLSTSQPASNHNGGWLGFGPDGYLYYSLGDGGGGGDNWGVTGNGQNLATRLGSILRLEVSGDALPTAPVTNPFVGVESADPLIWAYGLRNPWRPSFDRLTGDLYIADVGQLLYEEVNFEPANSPGGVNYGWRVMEGLHCYDDDEDSGNAPCFDASLTDPVHEYSHDFGCSITGGYVYRGSRVGGLDGTYFFADYCSHRVWSFRYNLVDGKTEFVERTASLDPGDNIFSFGEDETGEVYMCARSTITRIVDARVNVAAGLLGDFAALDANGDGVIDPTEAASADVNASTMAFVDADGDDRLQVSELLFKTGSTGVHSADTGGDRTISLAELLRVIQFFNVGGYSCAANAASTEDGYIAESRSGTRDLACFPHASDHLVANGQIDLPEVLRAIQLYNSSRYSFCPGSGTEDGFCPLTV